MIKHRALTTTLFTLTYFALATSVHAQTETPVLQIAQSGIGSNGFGTSWRGQVVELAEDAWLTRIAFSTGSASSQVDEIRLMTSVPVPTTLRSETTLTVTNTEVEAVLTQPYLLRGGTRYTVWFHQTGTPRGTSGCNLHVIDPSWGGYHTNVDPTVAPGAGEPGYFWNYQYGTNLRLMGWDNLEITGTLVIGGQAQWQLDAPALDIAFLLFGFGTTDLAIPGFTGPLRLDPSLIAPAYFVGTVAANGVWLNSLSIPNDPSLHGAVIHTQAFHDDLLGNGATFSPLETLVIQ